MQRKQRARRHNERHAHKKQPNRFTPCQPDMHVSALAPYVLIDRFILEERKGPLLFAKVAE